MLSLVRVDMEVDWHSRLKDLVILDKNSIVSLPKFIRTSLWLKQGNLLESCGVGLSVPVVMEKRHVMDKKFLNRPSSILQTYRMRSPNFAMR